jgi:hypothetical protein
LLIIRNLKLNPSVFFSYSLGIDKLGINLHGTHAVTELLLLLLLFVISSSSLKNPLTRDNRKKKGKEREEFTVVFYTKKISNYFSGMAWC